MKKVCLANTKTMVKTEDFSMQPKMSVAKAETMPDLRRKSFLNQFNEIDRKKILTDLSSPSAAVRVRAIKAMRLNEPKKRYSMFDVSHEAQNLVTEADKKALEQLPKTIQEVFKDTVAYVEVRSGSDDRTEGIINVLQNLGAKTVDSLRREVTIFIFKEGLQSSYNKAKQLQIPIVSVLWIEACRKHLLLVNPADYPISDLNQYEARYKNPELHKRLRRPKSMTPVILDKKSKLADPPATPMTPAPLRRIPRMVIFKTPECTHMEEVKPSIDKQSEVIIKEETEDKTPVTIKAEKTSPVKEIKKEQNSLATTVSKTNSNLSNASTDIMNNAVSGSWAKLLENMSKMNDSCKTQTSIKSEQNSMDPFELYDTTPKQTAIKNRRRSLYTPNQEYAATAVSDEKVGKSEKRRTMYTPQSKPPEVKENKTTPATTPRPSAIKMEKTNHGSSIAVRSDFSHLSKSQPRFSNQNQSNHNNFSETRFSSFSSSRRQTISINMKAAVSFSITTTTTTTKRKFDFSEYEKKENTPPKVKPFLTPSARPLIRQNTPGQPQGAVTPSIPPIIQETKRRRTLFVNQYRVDSN